MKQKLIKSAIIIAIFTIVSIILAQFKQFLGNDDWIIGYRIVACIGIFIAFIALLIMVCVKKWRSFWVYPLSIIIGFTCFAYILGSKHFYIYSKNISKIAEREVWAFIKTPPQGYTLKVHKRNEVKVFSSTIDSTSSWGTYYVTVLLENKNTSEQYKFGVEISGNKNQYRCIKPYNILDLDYNQKYFSVLKHLINETQPLDYYILNLDKEKMDKYLTNRVADHINAHVDIQVSSVSGGFKLNLISPKYDLHNPKVVVANIDDLRQFTIHNNNCVVRKNTVKTLKCMQPTKWNILYGFWVLFDDVDNIDFVYDYVLENIDAHFYNEDILKDYDLEDRSATFEALQTIDAKLYEYLDESTRKESIEKTTNVFLYLHYYDYLKDPASQLEILNKLYGD